MPNLMEEGSFVPNITYLGSGSLPRGWQRPTWKLVTKSILNRKEGIAATDAPHLYLPAHPLGESASIKPDVELLHSHVDPDSPSKVKAVGMAHPQLIAASKGSYRLFVAATTMKSLHPDDRVPGQLFVNPTVKPVEEEGYEDRIDMCVSISGVATLTRRWKVVDVIGANGKSARYEGDSAHAIQHEDDHLNGKVCIDVGLSQGNPLFYVPPEVHRTFFDEYVAKGRLEDWELMFSPQQWQAMKNGLFTLRSFESLL